MHKSRFRCINGSHLIGGTKQLEGAAALRNIKGRLSRPSSLKTRGSFHLVSFFYRISKGMAICEETLKNTMFLPSTKFSPQLSQIS